MDTKSIINLIREASPLDLFLISFFLLPFVFDAWLGILQDLGLESNIQLVALGIVLAGYLIGVIAMARNTSRAKKCEIARDAILNYLQAKTFTMVSFERIRQNINDGYSNAFLESVIAAYPNELRKARLKGGKPGMARLEEDDVEDAG